MKPYHDPQLILMPRSDVQALQDGDAGSAVRAVCAALRSVCLADDNRPLDVPDGRVPGGRHASNPGLEINPNLQREITTSHLSTNRTMQRIRRCCRC